MIQAKVLCLTSGTMFEYAVEVKGLCARVHQISFNEFYKWQEMVKDITGKNIYIDDWLKDVVSIGTITRDRENKKMFSIPPEDIELINVDSLWGEKRQNKITFEGLEELTPYWRDMTEEELEENNG